MKKYIIFFSLICFYAGNVCAFTVPPIIPESKSGQFESWFYIQKPIKIIDNSMLILGNTNDPQIKISLIDLIYNHGHMCNGVAVGYRAVKLALASLFANETPKRGEIRVQSSVNSCPADIFAHILGVRSHYGKRKMFGTLITPDHCDRNNDMSFIFQRIKKMGKKINVLKTIEIKLIKDTIPKKFYKLHKLLKNKTATPEDKIKFKKLSKKTYTKIMFAKPQEIFSVKELSDYKFPASAECGK